MADKSTVKAWIYHGEWLGLMATIVGCFLFVHHESVHVSERLDKQAERLDRHIADINKRSDELHKEFYDLLKEMRNEK